MLIHKDLSLDRWSKLSLAEQMSNIGSEVIRALRWKEKGNSKYAKEANLRALELFDLTLSNKVNEASLKEVARSRELWLDYFLGKNQYRQTAKMWEKYFFSFNFLAQNK